MGKLKKLLELLALGLVFMLINMGMDRILPFLKESAFFHGFIIFVGTLLACFPLLLVFIKDPMVYPRLLQKQTRFSTLLLMLSMLLAGLGIGLMGLAFWLPGVASLAGLFVILFVVSFLTVIVLFWREDKRPVSKSS